MLIPPMNDDPQEEAEGTSVIYDDVDDDVEISQLMHPEEAMRQEAERRAEKRSEEVEEKPAAGDDVIAQLRAEIAELRNSRDAEKPASAEPAQLPFDVPKLATSSIIQSAEDPSDFIMSRDGMNEFATRIINSAVEAAIRLSYPIMEKETRKTVAAFEYSKQFYMQYPELRSEGSLVEEISTEIEKRNPTITPDRLKNEVAKEAYKKLGKPMPQSRRVPGFTSATSVSSGGGSKLRGTSNEVMDLINHRRGR